MGTCHHPHFQSQTGTANAAGELAIPAQSLLQAHTGRREEEVCVFPNALLALNNTLQCDHSCGRHQQYGSKKQPKRQSVDAGIHT